MTCSSTFLKYQAGKMSPFYPLGISRIGPASKSSLLGHVIIHLLTKLVRSRWLNIGLIHFCIFIDQDQAVLCGPWHLLCNFCSRVTRKSLLFHRNIFCWAHWISQVESAGLPSIVLRAQPFKRKAGSIKMQISSHLNLTPSQ